MHERDDNRADEAEPDPQLSEREAREVQRRRAPTAQVLHETVRLAGEHELERPVSALLWSSIAAGLSMGFSLLAPALVHARVGGSVATPLLAGFGYSIGFLLVILGKQQLFTENVLTAVLPAMASPTPSKFLRLLRLWGVVLLGNLLGLAMFDLALVHLPVIDAATQAEAARLGQRVMAHAPLELFGRGMFAGWLIAVLVWLLPGAGGSKVVLIVIVTGLIGFGELVQVVVGSAEALYLVFSGAAAPRAFLIDFLLPTLAGNVVGDSLIFALISHPQVRSDAR